MKKIAKGNKGYIDNLKKRDICFIFINVLIAVIIFAVGMLIWKNKANVATIFAVCSLLPGCKRVVNLIMIFPFKGISNEDYAVIKEKINPENEVKTYTDMLFATEKCFLLFKHVVLTDAKLIAFSQMTKDKNDFADEYLNKGFQIRGLDVKVTVYSNLTDYIRVAQNAIENGSEPSEEIKGYLESLFV